MRVAASGDDHDCPARVVMPPTAATRGWPSRSGLSRFAPTPKRWAFGAYFTDVDGLTTRGEMHIRPDGYIGDRAAARRRRQRVRRPRVCKRMFRAHADRRGAQSIASAVDATIPMLRERFARARQVSAVTSLGPLRSTSPPAARDCCWRAMPPGFIDPMTGDGLRFALRGGELAAEAALRELESGAPAYGEPRGGAAPRVLRQVAHQPRAFASLVGSPRARRRSAGATSPAAVARLPVAAMLVGDRRRDLACSCSRRVG